MAQVGLHDLWSAGGGAYYGQDLYYTPEQFGAIGDGIADDTLPILNCYVACPAGGAIKFSKPSYRTTRRWLIQKKISVEASRSEIFFDPILPLVDDRAVLVHSGDVIGTDISALRDVAGAISIGDPSFTAVNVADVADLVAGDWVQIQETEAGVLDEIVVIDWAQVLSVAGAVVTVVRGFRTSFPATHDTVQFRRIIRLVEGVSIKGLKIRTTNAVNTLLGFAVGIAKDTILTECVSDVRVGNGYYSYRAKGLRVTNCSQYGQITQTTEFAATVDLQVSSNYFNQETPTADVGAAPINLDFGTAFFTVDSNVLNGGWLYAASLMFGCHDGSVRGNVCSWVGAGVPTIGILSIGSFRVICAENIVDGVTGVGGIGIAFYSTNGYGPGVWVTHIVTEENLIVFNLVRNCTSEFGVMAVGDTYISGTDGTGIGGSVNVKKILDLSGVAPQFRETALVGTNPIYNILTNTGGRVFYGVDNSVGNAFVGAGSPYAFCILTESARAIVLGTQNLERMRFLADGKIRISGLSSFANDVAAGVGGLTTGMLYLETGTDPLRVTSKI